MSEPREVHQQERDTDGVASSVTAALEATATIQEAPSPAPASQPESGPSNPPQQDIQVFSAPSSSTNENIAVDEGSKTPGKSNSEIG